MPQLDRAPTVREVRRDAVVDSAGNLADTQRSAGLLLQVAAGRADQALRKGSLITFDAPGAVERLPRTSITPA